MNSSTRSKIAALFSVMNSAELREASDMLRDSYRNLERRNAYCFHVGDQVYFKSSREGVVRGVVDKVNRKTIGVVATSGMKWRVSPNILKKIEIRRND